MIHENKIVYTNLYWRQAAYPNVPSQAVSTLLPRGFVCLPYLSELVVSCDRITLPQTSSVGMGEGRSNDCKVQRGQVKIKMQCKNLGGKAVKFTAICQAS